jgi:hypothetical protein
MASVSLHDLGINRLSIEDRIQVAEAIWDSVIHDGKVELAEPATLPEGAKVLADGGWES